MTSRERLLAALHGEMPDRLPWAPEFNIRFCDRILREIPGREYTSHDLYIEACRRMRAECFLRVDAVTIETSVADYLYEMVGATRTHHQLRLGVSPRGGLLFARIVRARALALGRAFVVPEDVKELAVPTLAHRVLLDTKAKYGGVERSAVIDGIAAATRVPR